jgi:hypothetical protein
MDSFRVSTSRRVRELQRAFRASTDSFSCTCSLHWLGSLADKRRTARNINHQMNVSWPIRHFPPNELFPYLRLTARDSRFSFGRCVLLKVCKQQYENHYHDVEYQLGYDKSCYAVMAMVRFLNSSRVAIPTFKEFIVSYSSPLRSRQLPSKSLRAASPHPGSHKTVRACPYACGRIRFVCALQGRYPRESRAHYQIPGGASHRRRATSGNNPGREV